MTAMLASVSTRPAPVSIDTSRQVETSAPHLDFAATLAQPAPFGPAGGFPGAPGAPGLPGAGMAPSAGSTAAQVTLGVATGLLSALPGGAAIASRLGGGGDPQMQNLWQMQREAQAFNSQYLYLQETLQKDTREFTARSNLSKALHETMKGTLSNIGR